MRKLLSSIKEQFWFQKQVLRSHYNIEKMYIRTDAKYNFDIHRIDQDVVLKRSDGEIYSLQQLLPKWRKFSKTNIKFSAWFNKTISYDFTAKRSPIFMMSLLHEIGHTIDDPDLAETNDNNLRSKRETNARKIALELGEKLKEKWFDVYGWLTEEEIMNHISISLNTYKFWTQYKLLWFNTGIIKNTAVKENISSGLFNILSIKP